MGGHKGPPWEGMRLTIRWQRHVEESLQRAWDIECLSLSYLPATGVGTGSFGFASRDPIPADWLQRGELVELLSGFRVLAVGQITGNGSP